MDVQLEAPGGLVRQMRVKVPAERVTKALDQRLKQIASRAKIPGFRPGKAPFKVIQRQYGDQARMEVVSDLVGATYPEALQQAGVNPASRPDFEITGETAGAELEYIARFEVYPEIALSALDKIKVERPQVEVTEADVDKLIESLRKSRRTLDPVTRPAEAGDTCVIDFEGRIDGVVFDGGKGEKAEFEIGAGRFLPDLENGIVGHAAGETFDVPLKFPDDYQAEALRGRDAVFAVTLREVKQPLLPEIDEEFLKAHNVAQEAGIDGLRAKCRDALRKEADKAVRNRVKTQVLDQLLAQHPIEVPQAMVMEEVARLREETAARFNAAKLSPEQKQKMIPDEILAPQANKRVALGLLIGEVIKARSVSMDEARLEQTLDDMAADYEQTDQVKQYYRSRPDLMQGIRAMVLEEQVVDTLAAEAKTVEQPMSLDELLNPRNAVKSEE